MGLFKGLRRQRLRVIEWKDSSRDTVVYRFPVEDRTEIMTGSTLVVRESQVAIFVHKGKIADVFEPGTYKLSTENIPILTKVLSLATGFESPIKAEVYYVNTKQFTGLKWGTQNPIMMRDKEYGNIRLRGFGIYSFRVTDASLFMKEMFGTNEMYTVTDVSVQMKPMIIQAITDAIAESKISALDLASNYKEFSDSIIGCSEKDFNKFGLKLCTMVIENLSLPEEVEKALDERTKMGIMEEKMGTYAQYQATQAMRDAAKNTSGGNLAGLGIGLGAGTSIGGMFGESIRNIQNKPKDSASNADGITCSCGAVVNAKSKFCPECGAKIIAPKKGLFCPECGEKLREGAKFCSSCGTKLK